MEIFTSETILTNVRVLAIDQTVEDKNGQKFVVGKTATLELGSRQAETLALARQLGTRVARAAQRGRQRGKAARPTSRADAAPASTWSASA